MQRQNVADLSQSPMQFVGVYRICNCQQRIARTGKNYLRLSIEDSTGVMTAYAWQQDTVQAILMHRTHLLLHGKSRFYNGSYVADVLAAEQVAPTSEQRIATLPYTQCPRAEFLPDFASMILSVKHDGLRTLLVNTFGEDRITLPFIQVPASLNYHHNYSSGLLVHSLECARIISDLSIFNQQDRDLGIAAALLHDLGKIKTIGIDFSRPEIGKSIDHEAITLELCAPALVQLDMEFPKLAIDLRHVLTCRSIKRWGHEAKLPIAHALQLADRLSSDKSLHRTSSDSGVTAKYSIACQG